MSDQLIEFTELITADGEHYPLDGIVDRALVSGPDGSGMPPIEYATQRGAYQHGATVTSYKLEPRIVQLVYRRNAHNRDQYWRIRDELVDILRPNRQTIGSIPQPLVLRGIRPDGTIRDLDVLIALGPEFNNVGEDWDEWSIEEALRLIAHNPAYYDPNVVHIIPTFVASSELAFPISFPISFGVSRAVVNIDATYVGNWLAYPLITITGPSNYVRITNLTTNETITFAYPLIGGQQAVIDLQSGTKSAVDPAITDITDPRRNLLGGVGGDLGTFHIEQHPMAAGGVNSIEVYFSTPTTFGSVDIAYKTRYLSN
jgi:hypothetical protein